MPVTVVLQRSLVLAVVPVTVVPQLRCCCLSCRACRSRAAACSCRMCRKCLDKHIWLLVVAPWATHRLLAVLNVKRRKFGQTELVEYATALECKYRIAFIVLKHLSEAYAASWNIAFSVHRCEEDKQKVWDVLQTAVLLPGAQMAT